MRIRARGSSEPSSCKTEGDRVGFEMFRQKASSPACCSIWRCWNLSCISLVGESKGLGDILVEGMLKFWSFTVFPLFAWLPWDKHLFCHVPLLSYTMPKILELHGYCLKPVKLWTKINLSCLETVLSVLLQWQKTVSHRGELESLKG